MERKDTRKTSWTKVASVDAKSPLSCTAQKLLEDVPYLFRVIAVNEEGQSPPLEADKEIVPKAPAGEWRNSFSKRNFTNYTQPKQVLVKIKPFKVLKHARLALEQGVGHWVYKKKYPFQKIKENKREKHMSERFF